MKTLPSLTAALLIVASPLAYGEDWTRFRGPEGSGVAAASGSIPTELSKGNTRWEIDLKGGGHSSPVTFGDKLFYTVTPAKAPEHREVVRRVHLALEVRGDLVRHVCLVPLIRRLVVAEVEALDADAPAHRR